MPSFSFTVSFLGLKARDARPMGALAMCGAVFDIKE